VRIIRYLVKNKNILVIFIFLFIFPNIVFILKIKEGKDALRTSNKSLNRYEVYSDEPFEEREEEFRNNFSNDTNTKAALGNSFKESYSEFSPKKEALREKPIVATRSQSPSPTQEREIVINLWNEHEEKTSLKLIQEKPNLSEKKKHQYDIKIIKSPQPNEDANHIASIEQTSQKPAQIDAQEENIKLPKKGVNDHINQGLYLLLRHTEWEGIGYKKGYTTAEGQFISNVFNFDTTAFVDLRFHRFNNNEYASNTGIGIRYLSQFSHKVFGLNVYYDSRKLRGYPVFNQMSIGLELLYKIDFRFNCYFPIQNEKEQSSETRTNYDDGYYMIKTDYVKTLNSIFFEIGGFVEKRENFSIYGAIGQYYLEVNKCQKAFGGQTRIKVEGWNIVNLEVKATYDTLFESRFQIKLGLEYKWGKALMKRKRNDLFRYCHHNEIIPIHKSSKYYWNW
jgi:hypothetical protein